MALYFNKSEISDNYVITKRVNRGKTVEVLGTINTNLEISLAPDLKKP